MDRALEFEQILGKTQAQIRAYVAGLGVSLDYVDDVAQDVYVEFYKSMERVPPGLDPVRWLKGIARNLSMRHFRECRQRTSHLLEGIAEILSRLESSWEKLQGDEPVTEALQRCLEKMSPRNRRLVTLRYEEELSSEAIAEMLTLNASGVRMTLMRARQWLKECVTRAARQEGCA